MNISQREQKTQPKVKTEMTGKDLTIHAGLLPVMNFINRLEFRDHAGTDYGARQPCQHRRAGVYCSFILRPGWKRVGHSERRLQGTLCCMWGDIDDGGKIRSSAIGNLMLGVPKGR